MQTQRMLIIKTLLLLLILSLLTACAKDGLKDSENLSKTEIESMKADLKLEMITPPNSKKLAENLITPMEIERFVIEGEGNRAFAKMISDKIIARIKEGGYVQVVKRGGAAKLSGTLRIGQLEKFQEEGDALEIPGENEQQEGSEMGRNIIALGKNTLEKWGIKKATGQTDIPVKKTNIKRMSAFLVYKLTQGNQIIDSGDIKKELNEAQSALLYSKVSMAKENSRQTSDSLMVNKLLDILADSVVAEISPHPQLFPFNWMDSGCTREESFELGLKYAKQNLDSEAEEFWKNLETNTKDNECRAAVLYNRGLLILRTDPKSKIKQTEAYNMFVEADALNRGNEKYIMPAVKKLKKIALAKYTPIDSSLRNSALLPTLDTYRLYVNTVPEQSHISILNSRSPYEPGIELKPGRYRIKVSAPGHRSKTEVVKINDHDVTIDVNL